MIRSFATTLGMLLFMAALAPAQENPPAPKKSETGKEARKHDDKSADTRKLIIERIKKNMEDVREKLAKEDASLTTRERQKKIIEDMDRLLDQQNNDKDPNSGNRGDATNNPENLPSPQPKPVDPNAERPKAKTAPLPEKAVGPQERMETRPKQDVGRIEEPGNAANHKNTAAAQDKSGRWGELPAKHREEMNAFARDRFIRNYEELLRAYYRTIAESGRR